MYRLGPGQAAYIHDYSADPRLLLRLLADPIRALRTEGVPLVHVRRGWLHGTHLAVTVRPLAPVPVSLDDFADAAGRIASGLPASAPDTEDYLARADKLARLESVPPQLLGAPYPQGYATAGPAETPERWSDTLLDARDQLAGRLTEPILASAAIPDEDILVHAARILALTARAHPYGIGIGTLPLRSHSEGIWSATGGSLDLRAAFTERFARDREVFLAAFRCIEDADAGAPGALGAAETGVLRSWNSALYACWGIATALTASGAVDESVLEVAGPTQNPFGKGVPSPFHHAARLAGLSDHQPYWHIAHRMLLNVLYGSLSTLGVTPVQRFYLCFGVSSAADAILGEDWSQRMERISRLAQGHPAAAV